jgi:prophage antirepressor-like protein
MAVRPLLPDEKNIFNPIEGMVKPGKPGRIVNRTDGFLCNLKSQSLFTSQSPVVTLINESGLYSLVLLSRKPEAKRFKRWVTSEVIPSIRKTGGYIMTKPEESPEGFSLTTS